MALAATMNYIDDSNGDIWMTTRVTIFFDDIFNIATFRDEEGSESTGIWVSDGIPSYWWGANQQG
jgi:hypothetical protein